MSIVVEHYTAERVPNPNPEKADAFYEVRSALVAVCQRHGVTGPDDISYRDDRRKEPDAWVVDDQYNDELYQYLEIYNRDFLSPIWIQDMMAVLAKFPGWGAGVTNIRFAYLLIFSDKLMVNGFPFAGCNDVESVAKAARTNLWGVKGEVEPICSDKFNREELLTAGVCGCYSCCTMFDPSEIVEWSDPDEDGVGCTGVCPHCGKSKLLAAKPTFKLEMSELRRLSELAFGPLADRSIGQVP